MRRRRNRGKWTTAKPPSAIPMQPEDRGTAQSHPSCSHVICQQALPPRKGPLTHIPQPSQASTQVMDAHMSPASSPATPYTSATPAPCITQQTMCHSVALAAHFKGHMFWHPMPPSCNPHPCPSVSPDLHNHRFLILKGRFSI